MGMDLFSGDATMWWEQWRWPKLLRLAQAHGWQPLGTVQPPEAQTDYPGGRWDGNDTSNDDQTVLAEDAQALADALERVLLRVPDEDALAQYARSDESIEIAPNHPPAPDADVRLRPEKLLQEVADDVPVTGNGAVAAVVHQEADVADHRLAGGGELVDVEALLAQ